MGQDGIVSDGDSNVAIPSLVGGQSNRPAYELYGLTAGQPEHLARLGRTDARYLFVIPQPSGFLVDQSDPETDAAGTTRLVAYDHAGNQLGEIQINGFPYPSPAGGVFPFQVTTNQLNLEFVDGHATRQGAAVITTGATSIRTLGIDRSGHALAIWTTATSTDIHGRWFDRTGAPLTSEFSFPAPGLDDVSVQAMNDDSLVLWGWAGSRPPRVLGVFADKAIAAQPGPAWLRYNLISIRGGNGYATRSASCLGVEIIANDGTDCGCILEPPQGTSYATVDVGLDGSVFWTRADGTRWYPALLK